VSRRATRTWLALAGFLALSYGVAAIGGAVTGPAIDAWYAGLARPPHTPPDWLFAPVWTVLYGMIAVAGWLAWRRTWDAGLGWTAAAHPLFLWGLQLVLNLGWTLLFFGLRDPMLAFVEILVLLAAIALTICAFQGVSRAAAWLLVPYFLWVGYAATLTFGIVQLNPSV